MMSRLIHAIAPVLCLVCTAAAGECVIEAGAILRVELAPGTIPQELFVLSVAGPNRSAGEVAPQKLARINSAVMICSLRSKKPMDTF
jgi:hypothetical protein